MRTMMIALAAAAALLLPSTAADAAPGCKTQREARAQAPGAYLKYRVIGGKHCWYAPGKVAKRKPARSPRKAYAALVPEPAPPARPAVAPMPPPTPPVRGLEMLSLTERFDNAFAPFTWAPSPIVRGVLR